MLLLLVPPVVASESIGVTPPSVEIPNAQRGQSYQRQVTLQNQFDNTTTFEVKKLEEAGNWTTTVPATGFQVPPRSNQVVNLTVAVPSDTPNGVYTGYILFVTENKTKPDGSGFVVRYSVGVNLTITVGGTASVVLTWQTPRTEDIEVGSSPRVFAKAKNDGNVRTTAHALVDIFSANGTSVLLQGSGQQEIIPGETKEFALSVSGSLPLGNYRARVQSDPAGFEANATFKVVPVGQLGKSGTIRYLQHEPRVEKGQLVKVTIGFLNDGKVDIGQAKFKGEVYREGLLVATFESDALVAPVGKTTNLTAFFTPNDPGSYEIKGSVLYDGLQTESTVGVLAVESDAKGGFSVNWMTLLFVFAFLLAVALAVWGFRKSRKREEESGPKRRPGESGLQFAKRLQRTQESTGSEGSLRERLRSHEATQRSERNQK